MNRRLFTISKVGAIAGSLFLATAGLFGTAGTASAASVSPAVIVIPIGPGSSGASVSQWQEDLRAWQNFAEKCRPAVTVDGSYGPLTTSATGCFQRVHGIADDGVVGRQTLGAMCSELRGNMHRPDLADSSTCS